MPWMMEIDCFNKVNGMQNALRMQLRQCCDATLITHTTCCRRTHTLKCELFFYTKWARAYHHRTTATLLPGKHKTTQALQECKNTS